MNTPNPCFYLASALTLLVACAPSKAPPREQRPDKASAKVPIKAAEPSSASPAPPKAAEKAPAPAKAPQDAPKAQPQAVGDLPPDEEYTSPKGNHVLQLWSKSCRIRVSKGAKVYTSKLDSVGPCSISRNAKNKIQSYRSKRGDTIVIGSSVPLKGKKGCDVILHGLLFPDGAPELSKEPQTPRRCGVDQRDELMFVLLGGDTSAMKADS